MIRLNLLPCIKNIIFFKKGKKPIQTPHLYQTVYKMHAKRSSVIRCETRPRLVRNSLRNSSFRMGKIFLREAPWLFRASVAKGPAGACVELLALLGPTRSVVVEAPLRFLPLSQAVVLSLLSHVSNGGRRMGEVRHTVVGRNKRLL